MQLIQKTAKLDFPGTAVGETRSRNPNNRIDTITTITKNLQETESKQETLRKMSDSLV